MSSNKMVLSSFTENENFYSCCTNFYESDIVRFLLGDSFHPGGIELTKQLTNTFNLKPGNLLIDIACGLGNSLIQTINLFQVVGIGIDLSFTNLQRALVRGKKGNIDTQFALIQADTHNLPFRSSSTKSIMSECSLCIFLNKSKAINEIFRVLEYDGQFGFTDVTKTREWPSELNDMFYRVACIADAKSTEVYMELLEVGGFSDIETDCNECYSPPR
ncbi:MAG: methyltransferase domain-containing protein, partial [Candidatus Heimdallarchaeota archaeon]